GEAFVAGYLPGAAFERERGPGDALQGEIVLPRALGAAQLQDVIGELKDCGAADAEVAEGWLAVGDGALRFAQELTQAGVQVVEADSPLHTIDATAICELGALAPDTVPDDRLLPDYRRSPDATLARGRPLTPGGAGA
ncbi:MAG TPA: hypothetical protein VH025_07970, partial [Solirubrobacteraceae bacterium]|nr:hypothetical protein [Solirubrobacteraceae bacterium]